MSGESKGQGSNLGQLNYNYATDEKKSTEKEFTSGGGDFNFNFKVETSADEIYRTPRSQAYLDIIASIDILSSTDEEIIEKLKEVVDEETLEEFIDMTPEEILEELRLCFQEEMESREVKMKDFPEPEILIGVVSKCYIGGCDIHQIDKNGNIIEHLSIAKKYNEDVAIARKIYHKINGNCSCIEIYNNCCRIIASDGTVTRVDRDQ